MKNKKIISLSLITTMLFSGVVSTVKPAEAVSLSEIKVENFQDELSRLITGKNKVVDDWNEDGDVSVEDLYLYYIYAAEIDGAGNVDLRGNQAVSIPVKTQCTKDSDYLYMTFLPEYTLTSSMYFDYAVSFDSSKLEFVEAKWEYEEMNMVRDVKKLQDYIAVAGIIKNASSSQESVEKIVTLKFAIKDTSASDKDISVYTDGALYGGDFEALKKGKIIADTSYVGLGEISKHDPVNIENARATLKVALGIEETDSDYARFVMDTDGNGKIQLSDALEVLRVALGIKTTDYVKSITGKESKATACLNTDTKQEQTEYKLLSSAEELEKYASDNRDIISEITEKYINSFEKYNVLAIKAPVYIDAVRNNLSYASYINNKNLLIQIYNRKETEQSRQMIMFVQIPKSISGENINIDMVEAE